MFARSKGKKEGKKRERKKGKRMEGSKVDGRKFSSATLIQNQLFLGGKEAEEAVVT